MNQQLESIERVRSYPDWVLIIIQVQERKGKYYRGKIKGPGDQEIEMRPTTYPGYLIINAPYYVSGFYNPYKEVNFDAHNGSYR